MSLHSTESLTEETHGRWCVLCSTVQVTSLPLSAGVGTSRYSLRTVTVPSGPLVVLVVWFPPSEDVHLMVAAGLPSAASHWATTTDWGPAWTVTAFAEFLGLAMGRGRERVSKGWVSMSSVVNVSWCVLQNKAHPLITCENGTKRLWSSARSGGLFYKQTGSN